MHKNTKPFSKKSLFCKENYDFSFSKMMRERKDTAATGYFPTADSADSITALVPCHTARATSATSALVGRGFFIMLSIISVAVMQNLPC